MSIYKKVPVRTLQTIADLIERLMDRKGKVEPVESYDELKRRLNIAAAAGSGFLADPDMRVIKKTIKTYPQVWPYLSASSVELLTGKYGLVKPQHKKKKILSPEEQAQRRETRQSIQHRIEEEG